MPSVATRGPSELGGRLAAHGGAVRASMAEHMLTTCAPADSEPTTPGTPEFDAMIAQGDDLAAAGLRPDTVAAVEWSSRAEDPDKMRSPRRVRNVVARLSNSPVRVQDEELRRELDAWREVLPRLP